MQSETSSHLITVESLLGRGHTRTEAQAMSENLSVRAEHRSIVERARKNAENLQKLQVFVGELLAVVQNPGLTPDLNRIKTLALEAGADPSMFVGENWQSQLRILTEIPDLANNSIQYSNDLSPSKAYGSIQSRRVSEQKVQTQIAQLCKSWFATSRPAAERYGKLFSDYPEIPGRGGGEMISIFELFSANIESIPALLAHIQEKAADSLLARPDMATYDAYRWVKQVSSAVANQELRVFPTPTTESVKDHIELAMQKRNGIFRYILFGDAGAGKTTMGKIVDAERKKETVVINFHHFLSFEELIGQMALSLDIAGSSNADKFRQAAERFSEPNSTEASFWRDMERVYGALNEKLKKEYSSVEDMVARYGAGLSGGKFSGETTERPRLRQEFLERLQTLHDQALLGLQPEESLAGKWVEGAVVQAIRANKVVCFDEIDKAGSNAIGGLLSFWGLKSGETWKYQGETITIPADWYCWGTSNSRAIGAVSGSEDMNRFLADRCEQINVPLQPVKDSLMIAAVHLSNETGTLLVSETDQQYLIAAFSHLIPRLQAANLAMPITNRVIETICSRLVAHDNTSGRYWRVRGSDGTPRSVAEALRLSILEMKQLSMSRDDRQVIQDIFADLSGLLGEGKTSSILDGLQLPEQSSYADYNYGFTANRVTPKQLRRRAEVVESVWQQPLFVAIGALQSDTKPFAPLRPRSVPAALLSREQIATITNISGVPTLPTRKLGGGNGERVIISENRLAIGAQDISGAVIAEASIALTDLELGSNPEVLADQTHETIAVISGNTVYVIKGGSEVLRFDATAQKPILVDPLGKYILFSTADGLVLQAFEQVGMDDPQADVVVREGMAKVHKMAQIGLRSASKPMYELDASVEHLIEQTSNDSSQNALVDVSPDGNILLVRTSSNQIAMVDVRLTLTGQPSLIPVGTNRWHTARFVGNNMIMGVGSTGQVLTNPADNPIVLVS